MKKPIGAITHVLYGVADRDPQEQVCMFFDTWIAMRTFARALPGTYRTMKLYGVHPDQFETFDDHAWRT